MFNQINAAFVSIRDFHLYCVFDNLATTFKQIFKILITKIQIKTLNSFKNLNKEINNGTCVCLMSVNRTLIAAL